MNRPRTSILEEQIKNTCFTTKTTKYAKFLF